MNIANEADAALRCQLAQLHLRPGQHFLSFLFITLFIVTYLNRTSN